MGIKLKEKTDIPSCFHLHVCKCDAASELSLTLNTGFVFLPVRVLLINLAEQLDCSVEILLVKFLSK